MKAIWKGALLAESDDIVSVEGNAYFPLASLRTQHLRPSDHHSWCPWKGEASYYHVEVNGHTNANAAWFYPQPKPEAEAVRDRVAFWRGVQVLD